MMKQFSVIFAFAFMPYFIAGQMNIGYPIAPVPFSEVKITDDFWSTRIRTNHDITIPIAVQKSVESGRIKNFKIAGGMEEGKFCSVYPFDDSDVFKIIEAASYSLQTFPDPGMEEMIDSLIDYIALAQEDDGYLYTNRTIGKDVHPWAGDERWELTHELSHELYNIGHMYEAAVAHYQATGKKTLLDVAIKSADLVNQDFGPGKIENYPGHQEIEIGLVKLYRVTGNKDYLDLAKFFLDVRGREGVGNPKTYDQSHLPVIDQREAVGHSVRAAYMWTAMADIAAITGDNSYMTAIHAIWNDVIGTKYYINGGIGATGNHEGFSVPYDLPNMSAYCETCAGVGNALWNHRMFLMTGESRFIDILERTMYNNILDGVSLSGDHFFYPNPLESYGQHQRSEWFGCACCPPNVARFLPSMPGYIYAQKDRDVYVNLYVSSEAIFPFSDAQLKIQMESKFPWEGKVKIHIKATERVMGKIKLRIPGYTLNRPVPGDLYSYQNPADKTVSVKLNGMVVPVKIDDFGYLSLDHSWTEDDIEIDFPYSVNEVIAHPNVKEDIGKLAIERGPLVYCAEWPDMENRHALNLIVEQNNEWEVVDDMILGGIKAISGKARYASKELDGSVSLSEAKTIKLIPYHLWNNRGPGEMRIWLPVDVSSTIPSPAPTIAFKSRVSASVESRAINAVKDQLIPESSGDRKVPYLHWWPKKDSEEWVAFDFDQPATIEEMRIYWYDDGPHGGCRIPDNVRIEYALGETWKEISLSGQEIKKDDWNTYTFPKVNADQVKIYVQLKKDFATGIHEIEFH